MTNLTLYQTLFDLELTLCERFNINPFELRREPLHEVCIFLESVNDHVARNGKKGRNATRVQAGDNDFF